MTSDALEHLQPEQLEPSHFLLDPRVVEQVRELRAACQGKQFSDIVDAQGHQYVDLVMEGGGTLGIALLGYVHALESVGIRFLSIGGTSAGSITALLLAALNRDKNEEKAARMVELLSKLNLSSLMDGDPRARRFIDAVQRRNRAPQGTSRLAHFRARLAGLRLSFLRVLHGLRASPGLFRNLGLNPGRKFLDWIESILKEEDANTLAKLEARVKQLPKGGLYLKEAPGRPPEPFSPKGDIRLALIAAEVSTGTKVDFPRTASLFWKAPESISPAQFVRASMSVPFFFFPLYLEDLPQDQKRWQELVGYDGELGPACTLVDGGIMSNFPISEFHSKSVPRTPTLGVKLGAEKRKLQQIGAKPQGLKARPLGQLTGAIFNAARHTLDYDFIYRNPDYRRLVAYIDTGTHNWLDFRLSAAAQVDLFLRGVKAGVRFLQDFNWGDYKQLRAQLATAAV
jgi:NTE family protein